MTTSNRRTRPAIARTAAALAVAGISAISMTLATPIAHADDVPIRSLVDAVRGDSKCLVLNYRDDLARAAYGYARGGQIPQSGYSGKLVGFKGHGDPAAAATHDAVYGTSKAGFTAIQDCKYKDYGVSLLRVENNDWDTVAIVLGAPPSHGLADIAAGGIADAGGVIGGGNADPLPQRTLGRAPVEDLPQQAAAAPTATVTSDVDVYDKPGGSGNVIGMLHQGDVVKLVKACPADDWCALADGRFAYGTFFKNS